MSAVSKPSENMVNRPSAQALLHARERRFLLLYSLVLLFCFSPSKALGQFAAVAFLLGLVFFVQVRPRWHMLRYTFILLAYTCVGLFYYLAMPEFSFVNYYLFMLTASSCLVLFYDFRSLVSASLLRKLSYVTLLFVFVEAVYGLLQAIVGLARTGSLDISNGDIVRGTIEPSFRPTSGGGNVMFALLLSTLLLFVLATSDRRLSTQRSVMHATVLLAWLLASVLHTILFFITAACAASLLLLKLNVRKESPGVSKRGRKRASGIIVLVLFVAAMVPLVLPTNVRTLPTSLQNLVDIREDAYSEKSRATFYTLYRLPEEIPLQPLMGIGPGQYSSRASLIRSGEYLRVGIPLSRYAGTMAERYILSLHRAFKEGGKVGSTYFPYYSWLTVYGETGAIGLLLVGFVILSGILAFRKLRSSDFPRMHLAMLALVIYLALCGFQDNYWEFTQAVFPAFLTLALCYAYLRQESRDRVPRVSAKVQARSGASR